MKRQLFAFSAALIALTTATAAAAATVYDNGGPDANGGNDATQWVQAEDFSFASDTAVTGAGVYLAGFDGLGNYDGNFSFGIFADAGGTPGSQLLSGSVAPSISDTGTPWCCGGNSYLFQFGFGSTFNALAGQTYYLGFHASSNFDRDDIYWVTTALNATNTGVESDQGTFDNWANNGAEHAFFLTDGMAAVPEPSAWALLILGMGTVGAAMRRRKQVTRLTFA